MTTDTSERGLESLICAALTGQPCGPPERGVVRERPSGYGAGWTCGDPQDYDREHCVDLAQLAAFLWATQPGAAESLQLDTDGPARRRFLARLQGETSKRGTVDVLRNGIEHGPHRIDLMYGTPSPGNERAGVLYGQNRFSVTRQLRYSRDSAQLALDLCLFVNGLPVATFELKNSLTKQTVDDAVEQYRRDRSPRERLFEPGRCLAHFAIDDHEVRFCTELKGKESWFLPFDKGWNDGAGNPPNPNGLKTDYLWKEVLTRGGLTDIIENYAQTVETRDERTGRRRREQLWPRHHQLDAVRRLLAPIEDDLSKGVLDAIDMDSYRVEKQAVRDIHLLNEDAEIGPVTPEGGGQKPEPEIDRLSNIVREFNDRFGNIAWNDQDKIERMITEELPTKVSRDRAYQNAMANSDRQNARIEHDRALERAVIEILADDTELFKQFSDNESFRRWLSEIDFAATYTMPAASGGAPSK